MGSLPTPTARESAATAAPSAVTLSPSAGEPPELWIIAVDATHVPWAIQVTQAARAQGVNAVLGPVRARLKDAVKDASSSGAPWFAVVSDTEVASKTVTLRSLHSSAQHTISCAQACAIVRATR